MSTNRRTNAMLKRLARESGRSSRAGGRRFTLAPLTFGLALGVGLIWATELLPRIWEATLPGGMEQASSFRGWPGLLWRSAYEAWRWQVWIGVAIVAVTLVGMPLARSSTAMRWGFRLLALLAVLLDVGLVFVTMRVALAASGVAGLG